DRQHSIATRIDHLDSIIKYRNSGVYITHAVIAMHQGIREPFDNDPLMIISARHDDLWVSFRIHRCLSVSGYTTRPQICITPDEIHCALKDHRKITANFCPLNNWVSQRRSRIPGCDDG